jgi:hypothetical protein
MEIGIDDVSQMNWSDVSDDGSIAAGSLLTTSGVQHQVVWRMGIGMTTLSGMLTNDYGLQGSVAGWDFLRIRISNDGLVLAGQGYNPDGFWDSWVADLRTGSVTLTGDFNQDGAVDATDYVVWRNGLGTSHTQADYEQWRANFGRTAASAAVGAGFGRISSGGVPEPGRLVLALLALFTVPRRKS